MRDYVCYLIRLCHVKGGETLLWRASLQRPGTADPIKFASLEEAVAFLRVETEQVAPEPPETGKPQVEGRFPQGSVDQ